MTQNTQTMSLHFYKLTKDDMKERITIGSKTYRRFIPYPEPVRDGTLRCISCGQIDGADDSEKHLNLHDDARCPAVAPVGAAQRTAPDTEPSDA